MNLKCHFALFIQCWWYGGGHGASSELLWTSKTECIVHVNGNIISFNSFFLSFLSQMEHKLILTSAHQCLLLKCWFIYHNVAEKNYKWIEAVHTWILCWKWDYICLQFGRKISILFVQLFIYDYINIIFNGFQFSFPCKSFTRSGSNLCKMQTMDLIHNF